MNSNVWGPHAWIFIHSVALNYPSKPTEKDKINYKNFFVSLQHVLPCVVCQNNYKTHLEEIQIDNYLNNRKDLFMFTVLLHNAVNKINNKPTINLQDALEQLDKVYKFHKFTKMQQSYDMECYPPYTPLYLTILLILIMLIYCCIV